MKKGPCQVGAIFHMRDIRRNVSPEFIELVLANVRGTNMAAVNREKHLLQFRVLVRKREFTPRRSLKVILFLIPGVLR